MSESEGGLVSEIKFLPRPSDFEQVQINHILEKHINIGMPRDEVSEFFKAEGFSSFVKDGGGLEEGEEYWILYLDKELFSPAKYKVVVRMSFVGRDVSEFSGVFLKNMY